MSDKLKTLSQAIRLGATFRPQTFGVYGDLTGTCALGAAAEALSMPEGGGVSFFLSRRFPAILNVGFKHCPVCRTCGTKGVLGICIHLNDAHRWTRERIADWVEQQEKAHP